MLGIILGFASEMTQWSLEVNFSFICTFTLKKLRGDYFERVVIYAGCETWISTLKVNFSVELF